MDWESSNYTETEQETQNISLSTFRCKNDPEPAECFSRAACSYTKALKELRINCDATQKRKKCGIKIENNDIVSYKVTSCRQADSQPKATHLVHEQNIRNFKVSLPEFLQHHRNKYSADEVALIWKKDCRTWLWKGVCNSRKKRKQFQQLVHKNSLRKC